MPSPAAPMRDLMRWWKVLVTAPPDVAPAV